MGDDIDFSNEEQKDKLEFKTDDEINNLIPSLDKESYEGLKNDIDERGIQNELIVTENGTIVCGNNRFKIAKELNIPDDQIPYKIKSFSCRMEMIIYAVRDNTIGRKLTLYEQCMIIQNMEPYGREIAEWIGIYKSQQHGMLGAEHGMLGGRPKKKPGPKKHN